jgi:hypothetical protein
MSTHASGRRHTLAGLHELLPAAIANIRAELESEDANRRIEASKYIVSFFASKDNGAVYIEQPAQEPERTPSEMVQWAMAEFMAGRLPLLTMTDYITALRDHVTLEEKTLMVDAVKQFVLLQRAANAPLIGDEAGRANARLLAEVLR